MYTYVDIDKLLLTAHSQFLHTHTHKELASPIQLNMIHGLTGK